MSEENKSRYEKFNNMLNRHGRSVADGLATKWTTNYPQPMEVYRDNVGLWIQCTVDGVVKFDSRYCEMGAM